MARRPTNRADTTSPLEMVQPRARVQEIVERQIGQGNDLLDAAKSVREASAYDGWNDRRRRWIDVTYRALETLFNTKEMARAFRSAVSPSHVVAANDPSQRFTWSRQDLATGVNKLQSIIEQLEFIPAPDESAQAAPAAVEAQAPRPGSTVFLVHGRADARKTEVARVLERTGPHPVTILHEQPNRGRTVIEKFEDHASAADYAVVLMTGDDVARLADEPAADLRARARQNVVFEFGFFAGRLGRGRVAVLYEHGVELPSDIAGVAFIQLDDGGRWEVELLRDLRAAGFHHDLNKL